MLELWGFSQSLSRLSEVLYVVAETAHLGACVLLDSYHLYKGGSGFGGIRLLNGDVLPVFHINDYPASPAREQIDDADRVYPGDGVAPLGDLMRTLDAIGFRGFLSVELFNLEYWKQPPGEVARRWRWRRRRTSCASPSPSNRNSEAGLARGGRSRE